MSKGYCYTFTRTLCAIIIYTTAVHLRCLDGAVTFDQSYYVTWGHHNIVNGENEVQLLLTNTSGNHTVTSTSVKVKRTCISYNTCVPVSGSGFRSKENFASGFFEMKIKLPTGESAGVITTFYVM